MSAAFELEAFTQLPFAMPEETSSQRGVSDCGEVVEPWSRAHAYGYIFYCPSRFAHAHVRLRHHLVGIELYPNMIKLQLDSRPRFNTIVKSGAFYFVPAGSSVEVQKEHACEYILITLDPTLCSRFLSPAVTASMMENMFDSAVTAKARKFRRDILKGEVDVAGVRQLIDAVLTALNTCAPPDLSGNAPPLSPVRLKRALDFIGLNYAEKLRVEDIAHAAGEISPFHFAHMFQSTLGQSPYQYLLDYKLHQARDLLTETCEGIANIAYCVGFSSQAHMTDAFSRRLGVTPAQVRRWSAPIDQGV